MIKQADKSKIVQEFGTSQQDTGSTSVQIALLSNRIQDLQGHMVKNKKDFSSQRGLMQMINTRKKLLTYLKRTSETEYKDVIKRLCIRK